MAVKDKRIEDLINSVRERQMKTNGKKRNTNGVEIVYEGPYFSIVPDALFRDRSIKIQAKGVYGILRSYAEKKRNDQDTATPMDKKKSVTQDTLAKDAVMSIRHLYYWLKVLDGAGWITIERRGMNQSNRYILHAKKKRKIEK